MNNEIRYFSMFSGVGGFELGLSNYYQRTPTNEGNKKSWSDSSHIKPGHGDGRRDDPFSCVGLQGTNDNKSKTKRPKTQEHSSCDTPESLQRTTFSCVGMSEIDKYASELLQNKFPEVKNYGDATKIDPRELPDFDMLCGGFPCQSFSIAGKRKGFEDIRGTMFFEIARILKVKRPKTLLLENVKGLLNHNKGETFRVILQTLDELGYEVQWMVLNSKFHGVPQNRERVFIIGNLRGERRSEILPFRQISTETDELQGQQTNTLTARYEQAQATGSYVIKSEFDAQATHNI